MATQNFQPSGAFGKSSRVETHSQTAVQLVGLMGITHPLPREDIKTSVEALAEKSGQVNVELIHEMFLIMRTGEDHQNLPTENHLMTV